MNDRLEYRRSLGLPKDISQDELWERLRAYQERVVELERSVADACGETGRTADELAFWKFQAMFHRAKMTGRDIMRRDDWKAVEAELEGARVTENRERYTHAEPDRDPGAT